MLTLQLGHPKIYTEKIGQYSSISAAIRGCFREYDEGCFFFWNGIPVRMRYQRDIAGSIDQILALCWMLSAEDRGESFIELEAQLCAIRIEFHWEAEVLTLKLNAKAHEDLYAPYARILNANSAITDSKQAFLQEWNGLLQQVNQLFVQAGVTIEDGKERRKLELLQRTSETIGSYGSLYSR